MRYILIFLIVCVLIVSGILLPSLYEQQFSQKNIKVQSRLKTIYEAVVVYHSIHNTYPDQNTCLEEFPVSEYYPWCFQRAVSKKGFITIYYLYFFQVPFDNVPAVERKRIFLDPYNKNKTFQYSLYEDGFLLWSIGPDKKDQFRNVLASESLELHEITNCIYDPSNGNYYRSKGDIVFSNIFLSDMQDMTIISYKEYSDDINEQEDETLEGYDGGYYYDESVDYEEETYSIGDAADKANPDVEYILD